MASSSSLENLEELATSGNEFHMDKILPHENIPALFSNTSWQSCFEAFITSLKSPRTQAFYANILSRFLKGRDPGAITKADIEAFTSGDLASSTIITRITAIRSFYRYASRYMVSGKKPLFKSALPTDGIQHRNMPTSSMKPRLTIPVGSRLPPHVTIGHEEATSGPASDALVQQRRYYLELIISDFLGDRPAVELVEALTGNPLVTPGGPFLFAANKCMPHPLGQASLKRLVDYFELIADNEHVWCSAYWRIANELASRLSPEKQPATM